MRVFDPSIIIMTARVFDPQIIIIAGRRPALDPQIIIMTVRVFDPQIVVYCISNTQKFITRSVEKITMSGTPMTANKTGDCLSLGFTLK